MVLPVTVMRAEVFLDYGRRAEESDLRHLRRIRYVHLFTMYNNKLKKLLDVIIVEDDPYYFLQMGDYTSKTDRSSQAEFSDPNNWIASLAPSYLK